MLLTIVGLALFPAFASVYSTMQLPENAYDLFRNVALFDLASAPVILVPPAWSLSVEWFFYLAFALGLARGRRVACAWFAVSVAITVYLVATGAPFGQRYTPPYAAALFFSLGAMLYHFLPADLPRVPLPLCAVLVVGFIPFPLLVELLGGDRLQLGYDGALALFLPLFVAALRTRQPRFARLDSLLGDLAYPLFVTHFFAGGLVALLGGRHLPPLGIAHCVVVLAVALALSLVHLLTFERWNARLRAHVRERANARRNQAVSVYARPEAVRT